jgi:hypothetical protein
VTDETGRGRLYGAGPDGAKPGATGAAESGDSTRVGVQRPDAQEQGPGQAQGQGAAWTPTPVAGPEPDAEAESADADAAGEPAPKTEGTATRPRGYEPAPREGERERRGSEARAEETPAGTAGASRAEAGFGGSRSAADFGSTAQSGSAAETGSGAQTGADAARGAAASGVASGSGAPSRSEAAKAAASDIDWFQTEPRRGSAGGRSERPASGADSGSGSSARPGSYSGPASGRSRDSDPAATVLGGVGGGAGSGGGAGGGDARGESSRTPMTDRLADFDMQSAPTSIVTPKSANSAPSSPMSDAPSAPFTDETAIAPRASGRTDTPTVRADDTWRPYGAASSADSLPVSPPPPPPSSPPRRPDRATLRYEAAATEQQGAWTPAGGSDLAPDAWLGGPSRSDAGTDVFPPDNGMPVRGSGRGPVDEYRTAQDYDRSRSAVEGLSVSERMSRFERMSAADGTAAGGWGSLPPGGTDEFDDYDEPDGSGMAQRPTGGSGGSGGGSGGGKPRSRRRRGVLISGGVAAVVVVVAAVLALTGAVTLPGLSAKPVPTVGFSPNSAAAGSPADQTGDAFLNDWENGNIKAASNITDNPAAALTAMTAFKKDLKLSGLTISPGSAGAAGWLTFGVTAQVGTPASAWTYNSGLAAYQGSTEGVSRWFVKWNPDLLFTDLKAGQHLALGTVPATVTQVADVNGTPITPANAPSLTNIVAAIEKNSSGAGGTPGQTVQVENAAGAVVSTVSTVSQPVSGGPAKSTFDLNIEAAAQSAAGQAANSSIVVIQPSTGDILAVANNPAGGNDTAMVGAVAPGSTFKTITTTMLVNKGLVTSLSQSVPCPTTLDAGGITLHNSEGESGLGNSYLDDFAASCNNAFSSFYNQVSTSDLAGTAQTYYGFNEPWDVGLGQPTTYGKVPDGPNNNTAEELVGQDQITTSPLAMASVAATIATGTFHQPILVPGTKQITATALPAATDSDLKTLMHAVVTEGTLAGVFTSDTGVYAKTGTAEYGPQSQYNNSWTIAFKDDYAVCALAVNGGFGASTAGPEVNTVLNAIDPN